MSKIYSRYSTEKVGVCKIFFCNLLTLTGNIFSTAKFRQLLYSFAAAIPMTPMAIMIPYSTRNMMATIPRYRK